MTNSFFDQLINVAVAEKVSTLRTEAYFQERASRADRAETLRIFEKAGKGNPPVEGDELPEGWPTKPTKRLSTVRKAKRRNSRASQ